MAKADDAEVEEIQEEEEAEEAESEEEPLSEEVSEELEGLEAPTAYAIEQERKLAIKAVSDKYNANGILNSIVVDALLGDTSVDEFKDIVLEALAKAPTTKQLNKVNITKKDSNTVESLRAELATAKSAEAKAVIARQLRDIR